MIEVPDEYDDICVLVIIINSLKPKFLLLNLSTQNRHFAYCFNKINKINKINKN